MPSPSAAATVSRSLVRQGETTSPSASHRAQVSGSSGTGRGRQLSSSFLISLRVSKSGKPRARISMSCLMNTGLADRLVISWECMCCCAYSRLLELQVDFVKQTRARLPTIVRRIQRRHVPMEVVLKEQQAFHRETLDGSCQRVSPRRFDCERLLFLLSLSIAFPLVHGYRSSLLRPCARDDSRSVGRPRDVPHDGRVVRDRVGSDRSIGLTGIVHLDLVRRSAPREERHALASIEHLGYRSVQVPDVDLSIVRARVDVPLASGSLGREMATDEGPQNRVACVGHERAVVGVLREPRFSVEPVAIVEAANGCNRLQNRSSSLA